MALPSLYESGDDECEIFGLVNPDQYPQADNDDAAKKEAQHLTAGNYNAHQDEVDEQARIPTDLIDQIRQLPPEQLERIAHLIQDIHGLP